MTVRIAALVLSSLILAGCATGPITVVQPHAELVKVERGPRLIERWGEGQKIIDGGDGGKVFRDELLTIYLLALTDRIALTLHNQAEHSIKIIWNEVAFVDTNNQAGRVIHSGVRMAEKDFVILPPAVIPSGTSYKQEVVPANNIELRQGWIKSPLVSPVQYIRGGSDSESVKFVQGQYKQNHLWDRFGLMMPLSVQGEVYEYMFWFQVTSIETQTYTDKKKNGLTKAQRQFLNSPGF